MQSVPLTAGKLREGVVASHRDDDFARRAFGESVHCAIAAKDIPQLYAALNGTMALYGGKQADTHFTTLLLLYHLVHSPRPRYQAELDRCGVHPPFVLAAARVLAPETFDPRAYFIMVGGGGTARERIEKELLGWAAPRVREQALEMLRKAYMSTSVAWAVALLGGEEAIDGLKVENGVVKLR